MSRYVAVVVVVAFALLAFAPATSAHAADDDRFDGLGLWLEAQGGNRMPLGYYGLALELSASRNAVVSVGLGYTYEASFGTFTQKMIATRYRYPFAERWAASVGGGMSFGTVIDTVETSMQATDYRWRPAVRANAELSLEYRPIAPLQLRAFAGLGYIINEPTCWYVENTTIYDGPCPTNRRNYDRTPTFFGVALAYQVASFTVASPTRVTPPPPDEEDRERPESTTGPRFAPHWYGWQTLATDVLAVSLALAARDQKGSEWSYATQGASLGIYFAGAPAVHAAQRRPIRGLLSLAARVVLPLFGAAVAFDRNSYECSGVECSFVKGMIVGAVAASILDAALIANPRH